jgi:hypothetical protein
MNSRPDAPIGLSSDDLLGRTPFVDEIVDLAISTPKQWAPRIGIYGSWGSGKTSVLNMIAERLGEAHHVAARFNPWGYSDADEMFGALADAVLDAIEGQGDEIKKGVRRGEKIARTVQKTAKFAGEATKHAGDMGVPGARIARGVIATGGYMSGVLRRVFEKKKIAQLNDALGHLPQRARCVVLVDDIDRAEPSLLPPLLFALHEVLVAMPIVFVIALDPTVVGAALKMHHPGFGDGLSFLEKMIQFPRWLPDITDDDCRRLAEKDVEQYLSVLDRVALRQEFERFPTNPRELRTLLRGLWGLNSQAKRYRDGEISWNLVLRLAVLRQKHRRALDVLLEKEDLLTGVAGFHLAASRRKGRGGDHPVFTDPAVEAALRERGVDTACVPEIIEVLATHELAWDGASIIRHAHLVERPPALTRLEFERLISSLPDHSDGERRDEDVRSVLGKHAQSVHRSLDHVADEALSHVLAMHNEHLEHSADGVFEDGTVDRTQAAARTLALIGAIVRSQVAALSSDQFRRILFAFSRWAHFNALDAYRALHASEQELLLQLCRAASDPGAYLEVLEPWNRYADHKEEAIQLRRDLEIVLEDAITETLDRILEKPDGVGAMLREHRASERWCLLRKSTWTPARITRFTALDTDAASDNALDLLRVLANPGGDARPNRHGIVHRELDAMAGDPTISGALWTVLTRRPVQVRFFSSVDRIKAALEQHRGAPLPEPPWWERVRATRAAMNDRTRDETAEDLEPAIELLED